MKTEFKTNTEAKKFLEEKGYFCSNPQSGGYANGPIGKIGTKYGHMIRHYPGATVILYNEEGA